MEVSAQSLSHAKLGAGSSTSVSPPIFHSKPSLFPHKSIPFQYPNSNLFPHLQIKPKKHMKSFGLVLASDSQSESTFPDPQLRWLLQPVGDGDSRHIGFEVKMRDAFEIASSEVTVGRLPEKVDMVIPVATVSGVHARIQKKGENLLVTDLDSTNGTFIDDKRLRPGVVATVSSGNCITFGDQHLAMFRVSKILNVEAVTKPQESEEDKPETSGPTESS